MRADKWLEINLVGLVILTGLAFVAAKLMDMNSALEAVQASAARTALRVEHLEQVLPNASIAEQKRLELWAQAQSERNQQLYALRADDAIDEAVYVPIGGIDQWITIRGRHRDNPVLLFLHGGPGDATNPWSYPYLGPWETEFTVVQWDQRGAGRTLERSGVPGSGTLNVGRLVQDGLQLSEYLRSHLHQQRIVLVGQSWGALLGVLMVKSRPELFSAFVGTGQIVDPVADARAAYQAALDTARASADSQALEQLRTAGPPPYAPGTAAGPLFDRWLRACEGGAADAFLTGRVGLALAAPGYTLQDVNDWLEGQTLSAQQLDKEELELAPRRLQGAFRVPIFIFQGARDCTAPASLARHYVEAIQAPAKAFVAIAGAGHYAVFTHSQEFLQQLVSQVRPLALAGARPPAVGAHAADAAAAAARRRSGHRRTDASQAAGAGGI